MGLQGLSALTQKRVQIEVKNSLEMTAMKEGVAEGN
jgi:hypothetical protein